ncbi:DUF1844 domain-containing protein [Candidatus Omnitrophota bacterium]
MSDDVRKRVDEDWKNQVVKEKDDSVQTDREFHEPSFSVLISSLSMQAMIAMGQMENPISGKKEENLEQSRFLIDTLGVLEDKTKGNLDEKESTFLKDSLYHLRMNYVEKQNIKNKGL